MLQEPVFLVLASLLALGSTQIDRHVVPCTYGQKSCECRADADECEFTMIVEKLQTFTSYNLEEGGNQQVGYTVEGGTPYYINNNGTITPSFTGDVCNVLDENFEDADCTTPLTVDGKTYRPLIAVNGISPGPTLIVTEGQVIIANVINNDITESITIHWHGMDQRSTPWMDGALMVTQCPLHPYNSFQYYFEAAPTGTFWYHSHRITQRTAGLFGGLIIRERANRLMNLQQALGVNSIIDDPGSFTLSLHEWTETSVNELFTHVKGDLSFFPGNPRGSVPLPEFLQLARNITPTYDKFGSTFGPDNIEVGDIPFFSGLINGLGRHESVPYVNSRLQVFNVNEDNYYRIRLIGAQSQYAYKFSIDEHNLTVIATDGTLIEPIETQFIIIHTGERYDFILNAQRPRDNAQDYWIRAETLELASISGSPPYQSLGHVAEAILHYTSTPDQPPRSTEYESIKRNSIPFDPMTCVAGGCRAVNCPFEAYHSSYNIECVNVNDFRALEPAPPGTLPSADIDPNCNDCEIFVNINSDMDALNGRNFMLPSAPLQTQRSSVSSSDFCDISTPCPNGESCECLHERTIMSYNQTIRLVLSSVGSDVGRGEGFTHPMHLHGHHFHVVEVGYGTYNPQNGFLTNRNNDIACDEETLCSNPSWRGQAPTFSIDNRTVTKDTVMVPAGGYVVIHIRSNNPGYWYLHCHIEADLFEGMALVFNMVPDRHNPAPVGINHCGNVVLSQDMFYSRLAEEPCPNGVSDDGGRCRGHNRGNGVPKTIPNFATISLLAVILVAYLFM